MAGTTRGRLPARVYWVRRLTVLAIAALLVVGIARLLGSGSDGSSGNTARQVADTSSTTTSPTTGTTTGPHRKKHHHTSTSTPTPVVMPSGPCPANDVSIVPTVKDPVAGSDVKLVFRLSSVTLPACTWRLSPTTLALKITSGSDLIWTSVQCGKLIPTEDLVLRQGRLTKVVMEWNARRSEPGCPTATQWALPGTYHLHVAPLAGTPQDLTFALEIPTPATITASPHSHHTQPPIR